MDLYFDTSYYKFTLFSSFNFREKDRDRFTRS